MLGERLLAGRTSDEIGRRPVLLAALGGIMLYAVADSVTWLFAARAVQGAATGLALSAGSAALLDLGGLHLLSTAIPQAHRAAMMSAFYVVAYLSISVPAILAGLAITPFGLVSTFEVAGTPIALLALVVAGEAWRTRPAAVAQNSPEERVSTCPRTAEMAA